MTSIETFALIDPTTVLIGTNIRTSNAAPSAELIESVRALGVITPVTVEPGEQEGTWLLRHGQRRVLAAVEAGLVTIPAVIVTPDGDPVARVVDQFAENEHRDAMTAVDRVGAIQQLALLGVSAGDIARRTGLSRKVVDAAKTVATSEAASDAISATTLTIEEAAVLAEFEDDGEAVEVLLAAHDDECFEQTAEELRQQRAYNEAAEQLREDLTSQGITVHPGPLSYNGQGETLGLDHLWNAAEGREAIDPEAHASTCPGHGVVITGRYNHETRREIPEATEVCNQWASHGHVYRYAYSTGGSTGTRQAGPMTDEQKAERREVIANNKAWDAATAVRERWITAFGKASGAVPDGEAFIARAILGRDSWHTQYLAQWDTLTKKVTGRTSAKVLTRTAVTGLLYAWHEATGRHTWRNPSERDARYLAALVAWGYQPSPVEKLLSGEPALTVETDDDQVSDDQAEEDVA